MKPRILLTGILLPIYSFTQILSTSGVVEIKPGAVVYVNGGADFGSGSSINNNGTLTITKNSTYPNPGNLNIESGATVSGNGVYAVEQDWVNNGAFNGGNSTVRLFGNTRQYITSTLSIITTFNNLELTGNGVGNDRKKTLSQVNAETSATGMLVLNDRELETQNNSFYVYNPSTGAVTFNPVFGSEGFVSSTGNGYLGRTTSTAGAYVFPTGSSAGTLRFRPVTISLLTNNPGEFGARLNNYDANSDSYDRAQNDGSVCSLNDKFYHSIESFSGGVTADLAVAFLPGLDGGWTGLSEWQTGNTMWNNLAPVSIGVAGSYSTVTKSSWNFAVAGSPFILSSNRSAAPILNCPSVCENSDGNVFSAVGTGTSYQWTFPANGSIETGQGTNTVNASWSTGNGTVSVVSVDASGCTSLPATCDPVVLADPDVHFSYVSTEGDFSFTDNTTGSASWTWDFGDGGTSTLQDPSHTYIPGAQFPVTLVVENADGCVGSETQLIAYFKEVVIPNVITPNNDGANDVFLINVPPVTNYSITIVNRWGSVVYKNDDPTKSWDGKLDGTSVTDGVYFYVLKFSTSTQDYSFQGNVSVFQH